MSEAFRHSNTATKEAASPLSSYPDWMAERVCAPSDSFPPNAAQGMLKEYKEKGMTEP